MYIQIKSGALTVDVSEPGHAYCGQRFDWTGFITQVTLNGKHTFCGYEYDVPMQGTGGIGLCGCFQGIVKGNYDETPIGGKFVNIGVGRVTRQDDGDYYFSKTMEVDPFETKVRRSERSVTFEQESVPCNGIKYYYVKTLEVEDKTLYIKCALRNDGEKAIRTSEFNHNFVRFDRNAIGSDYVLNLPCVPEFENHGDLFASNGKTLTFHEKLVPREFFCIITNYPKSGGHFWELTHAPSGMSMRESGDFEIDFFGVWGRQYVFSPEIFGKVDVKPGETYEWTRKYEFDVKEDK